MNLKKNANIKKSRRELLTISEVVSILTRESFEVTSQQVKKYEAYGLMKPADKTEANYRLYNQDNVQQLRTILAFRVINISLKKIKKYFDLTEFVGATIEFDKEKLKKLSKEELRSASKKVDELEDFIQLCRIKWEELKNMATDYTKLFESKEGDLIGIRKNLDLILKG